MHRKLLNQYFKTDGWLTPTIGQKSVDNSNTPSYNKNIGATTYDLDDAWKNDHEKELRYAGDSARESVDKGLKETAKFMKDAPDGTNYSDVQSASVKWSLAHDTDNKELKQSAFDELTGLLSTENKEEYLKKARPLQEFVDAKDIFDHQRKNYTTTKNSIQRFDQAVQNLQHKLNEKGYTDKFGEKLKEDGIYGGKTRFAEDSYVNSIHQITDKDNSTPKIQNLFLSADAPKPKLEKPIGNPEDIKNLQLLQLASRGGTRQNNLYITNKSKTKEPDFSNVDINHNNVVSVAENLASTTTGLSEPTTIKNIIDNGYKIKTGDLGVIKAEPPEMKAFVKKIAKALGLPEDLALAVVQTESSFEHWKTDGSLNTNKYTGDYGLMQINKQSHPDAFNSGTMDIINDWQHNAIYGLTFLKMCYATALKAGFKGDDLLKATYSKYNSGNCYSFQNPNHPAYGNVLGFWETYTLRKWE